MTNAFIYGAILAFGLIIPLGVQNIFVFNQGASQRRFLHAMPSVITAFVCDAILISLAVLGISLLVLTVPWIKITIFLVGICFLIYMGWVTWNTSLSLQDNCAPLSVKRQISFATSISLLNPHALLDTIGVIGTSSLSLPSHSKLTFTVACMLVSFFWFLWLAIAGHFLNKLDKSRVIVLFINKLSAFIMWSMAVYLGCQMWHM